MYIFICIYTTYNAKFHTLEISSQVLYENQKISKVFHIKTKLHFWEKYYTETVNSQSKWKKNIEIYIQIS